MQTPRGFLIGASVIAAIAALTSVGHPHTETVVETTAPMGTDVTEDTTATSPTTDSEVGVLAEHIEAGLDAGAAGARASGESASTTIELSNGGPAPTATGAISTPAAENRPDSAAASTVDAGSEEDRSHPLDPVVDSAPESTTPPTTLAPATTSAPTSTAPPTTLPPTTTVPATTTAPSATRVTLPKIDVDVPPVTLPKVVVPATVVPLTPTLPK